MPTKLTETFKKVLNRWRPDLSLKEKAAALDMDYPSVRKYSTGKRSPCKMARAELERRMGNQPRE